MQASESALGRDIGILSRFLGALRDELGIQVDAGALALVVALVLALVVLVLALKIQPFRVVLGRFAVGLPLDGQRRTNAEFFRSATRRLEAFEDMRPSPWHYKPIALRALIRWTVLAWLFALVVGWVLSSLLLLLAAGAMAGVWALVRWRDQVRRATVWAWEHRPPAPRRLAVGRGRPGPLALESAEGASGEVAVPEGEESGAGDNADPDDPASGLFPDRDMIRDIRDPIWDGARVALELSEMAKANKYLILPDSVDKEDSTVTVKLPRAWQGHPEQKALLDHAVMTRLPGEWDASYSLMGRVHVARYTKVARPPSMVPYLKVRDRVEKESSATAPVFGVGPRGKLVASDFKSESPHILLSMGSNAGKSSAIKAIVVPLLMAGAQLYIIDPKFNSHLWARGLPNVYTCSRIPDMFDAIVWLGEEAEERQMRIAEDPSYTPPLRVIVLEEMNLLGRKMRRHWRNTMPKGAKAGENPAFEAMADLSAAGRSASCHLVAVAQMLTTNTMGPEGNTTRENFSTRILGRYSRNNWKMLVPEVSPMPASSKTRGRVQTVTGGEATETQVIYYTDEEARAAALSGTVAHCPVPPTTVDEDGEIPGLTSHKSRPDGEGRDARDASTGPEEGGTPPTTTTPAWILEADSSPNSRASKKPFEMGPGEEEEEIEDAEVVRPIGPTEAHREGIFGSASLDSARKALNRAVDRGEIKPVEEIKKGNRVERKYDPVDLAEWWEARTSAKS